MDKKQKYSLPKAFSRLYELLKLEKKEITRAYLYAVLSGFILLSLPIGIQAIVNLLFGGTVSTSLIVLISIVIGGVFLTGILQVAQMKIIEQIQQRVFTRLTFAYAYRIPRISLLSIDSYYLPELVNRFFDTSTLQKGFSKLLIDFPSASIQIVFGLMLLSFYHPVFIIFAIVITILGVLLFKLTSKQAFETSMSESDYKYDVAHWLEEISRNVKTFKQNQQHELHLNKTDKLVSGYLKSRDSHFFILLLQYKMMVGFKVLITAVMLIIGSYLFINQQINLGQFIAAEIIILTILNSVEKMIVSLEVVYDVLTALEKLNKVLDKPDDIECAIPEQSISLANQIDIKIKDLSFNYSNKKTIINHLNLDIKAGEKVCLLGAEGSGKSTLIKLLAGFYTEFTGNILFNNVPIKVIERDVLSQKVAVLFADDEIFSGTLFDNLTIGNQNISQQEIDKACEIVGLSDFVNSQQIGYNAYLDTQGKKLSYNIIQKILLARCILIKPAILLIEDGWQGIETKIREQIIKYLTNKNNSFTLITITNDEFFASQCERKINMENGGLVDFK